jgi:Protein of unknown function (DUF3047)
MSFATPPLRRSPPLLALCAVLTLWHPDVVMAQPAVDLLRLNAQQVGRALPHGWKVRPVRGHQAPASIIVDSGGLFFLRIAGTARAAWFVHELPAPLPITGRLSWRWRVPLAPSGANLDAAATDDAALRVFVVFARRGVFDTTPRALFYAVADGAPPALPTGPRRKSLASIVAGLPAMTRGWMSVTADPIADYRRFWHSDAPRIVALGVMQDTDQTRTAAIGDLMDLKWSPPDVTPP